MSQYVTWSSKFVLSNTRQNRPMNEKPDYRYVKGLLNNDSVIIREIYDKFYPGRKNWLLKKGGKEHEAKDLFQDAIYEVYLYIQKENFDLYGSFEGFLHRIFSFKFFKKINKGEKTSAIIKELKADHQVASDDIFDHQSLINKLYKKHIMQLGIDCQKIIQLKLLDDLSHKQIAEQLNYTFDNTRQKYARCFRKLIDSIKNDVEARDLYE